MRGVIYVEGSKNSKLAGTKPIDSTYAAIGSTCSPTCPLQRDKLCYATLSYVGMINKRLEKESRKDSPLDLAKAEVRCIDKSYHGGKVPAGRDLRLHISGDSRTRLGSRALARAARRWIDRGGQSVFSYSHSWKHVERSDWGCVSVLASIESVDQAGEVRKQGYAPALIVPEHKSDKTYTLPGSSVDWIPCPAQTRSVHCSDCRLCMKADWLFAENKGITFAAHGVKKNSLKRHLTVIQ